MPRKFRPSSLASAFFALNRWLSRRLKLLAERLTARRNGNAVFRQQVLPTLLEPGLRVLDVGGGKRPQIDAATRQALQLWIMGVDLSAEELERAPRGAYDATQVGDISSLSLPGKFDLILSRSVLEHVEDVPRAMANLASSLREGGVMAHCIPCRNAPFAWLNRALGNHWARKLLFYLQPHKRETCGFVAHYHQCAPRLMAQVCERCGLQVLDVSSYYASEYFSFFAPLYLLELMRQLMCMWLGLSEYAETFVIVARRPVAVHAATALNVPTAWPWPESDSAAYGAPTAAAN